MEQIGYREALNTRLDRTFAALANPARREILERLASHGEAPVYELAKSFSMSQPAISRHLKVLEHAGLIASGTDAQRRPRTLVATPLAEATAWLEKYREFWKTSFERLDGVLTELKVSKARRTRTARKKR